MSKFLTAVFLLVFLVSCSKTYDSKSQPKVQTVLALNSGNPEAVISKLEGLTNLDDDDKYYLSSAYAMKGGLDVASLYPLLEMYLFNQPAYKWSNLKDVKDPYKKFLNKTLAEKKEDSEESRKKTLKEYDKIMRKRFEIDEIPVCDPDVKDMEERYLEFINQKIKERIDNRSFTDEKPDLFSVEGYKDIEEPCLRESVDTNCYKAYDCKYSMYDHYKHLWEYNYRQQNYLYGGSETQLIKTKNWEALTLELLWNTYEAIPFLQRIPDIDLRGQEEISKSLALLLELQTTERYKEKAFNNIVYLSALSLLSIYKKSFNLSKVENVKDIFCQFEPDEIYDFYPIVVDRVKVLASILRQEKAKVKGLDLQAELDRFETLAKDSPRDIPQDQREYFKEKIQEKKLEACILSEDN